MFKKFKKRIISMTLSGVMVFANLASPVVSVTNAVSVDYMTTPDNQAVEPGSSIITGESSINADSNGQVNLEEPGSALEVQEERNTIGQDDGTKEPVVSTSQTESTDVESVKEEGEHQKADGAKSEEQMLQEKREASFKELEGLTVNEEELKDIDFSSKRLIVATENTDVIIDKENVLSEYKGIYLLQYLTEEQAKNAYIYYSDKAEMTSVDIQVSAADEITEPETDINNVSEHGDTLSTSSSTEIGGSKGIQPAENKEAAEQAITEKEETPAITAEDGMTSLENPVAELAKQEESEVQSGSEDVNITDSEQDAQKQEADLTNNEGDDSTASEEKQEHPLIALIDTGASENEHVIGRVSMLGDEVNDDNGHGDVMVGHILEEDPDARILSIKALDKEGKGTISSIYAAMEYAISHEAKIINLSLYAPCTEENSALEEIVKRAVEQGIAVVGAAGNDGKNVKYYTPGNIEEAIIVGTCDDNGDIRESSNYGDTVDYYLQAGSTSEAAARSTGILSSGRQIKNENKDKPETIRPETELPEIHDEGFSAAVTSLWQVRIVGASSNLYSKAVTTAKDTSMSISASIVASKAGFSSKTGYHLVTGYVRANQHWRIVSGAYKSDIHTADTGYPGQNNAQYNFNNGSSCNLKWVSSDTGNSDDWIRAYIAPNTYYVAYNKNGGSGTMSNSTHTYDASKALTANAYTRIGYTFSGWSSNSNGTGTQFSNKQNVLNLSTTQGATYTVYAKWTANTYKISYNLNDATGQKASFGTKHPGSVKFDETLTVDNPKRPGYIFDGWNITGMPNSAGKYYHYDGTTGFTSTTRTSKATSFKNLHDTSNATVTFTAQWTPITYNLTASHWLHGFKNGEGTSTASNTMSRLDTLDGSSASNEVFRNHVNYGANTYDTADQYYTRKADTDKSVSKTRTIDHITNEVIYGPGEGTLPIFIKEATMLPPKGFYVKPVATAKWKVENAGAIQTKALNFGDSIVMPPGDTDIEYEYWPFEYNISYNLQDGVVNPNTQTKYDILYGAELLPAERDGYEFKGWKDQNGAIYKNGAGPNFDPADPYDNNFSSTDEIYSELKKRRIGDVTLTPIWKKVTNGSFVDEATSQLPALAETEENEGKFKIVEIKQTPGYILDPDNPVTETTNVTTATINDDGILEMEIENQPNEFIIKKKNKEGEALAGAKFRVWREGQEESEGTVYETSDGESATYTDRNGDTQVIPLGEIHVERCAPGYWYYREIEAPTGYACDTNVYPVYIKEDGTVEGGEVKTVVDPKNGDFIIKKISESGEPLEGVEFEILKDGISILTRPVENGSSMKIIDDLISDDNEDGYYEVKNSEGTIIATGNMSGGEGHAIINNLEFGTYSIKVDSFDGSIIEADVTLSATQNVFTPKWDTNSFDSSLDSSLLTYGTTPTNGTTDANGEIRLENLTEGTYTYREVSLPPQYADDYVMDTETHTFVARNVTENGTTYLKTYEVKDGVETESSTGVVTNRKNRVTIKKVDANGNLLNGATVEIYKDGTLFDTATLGTKEYTALKNGTYTYKETKCPPGYKTDNTIKPLFTVTNGKVNNEMSAVVSIRNTENSGILYKKDNNGLPVQGAKIKVTSESPMYSKEYTTGTNGEVRLEKMMPGTYTFKETLPGAGYLYNANATGSFTVNADTGAYTYTYNQGGNALVNYPNKLRIKKVDSEGNVMNNISFDVWKEVESPAEPQKASHRTNTDGIFNLVKLEPGTWHYQETSTKEGYVMDDTVHTFVVNDNGEISAGEGDTAGEEILDDGTVQFTITNHKKANLTVIVNKYALDKDGYSSPLASNNVIFKLYKVGDEEDELLGTLTNQGDGTYKITGIEISHTDTETYKVKEESTEPGYVCDFERTFQVAPDVDKTVTETMNAENPSNGFAFIKVDADDETTPLSNVKFKLSKVTGMFTFGFQNEDLVLTNAKTAVANKYGTDANGILITNIEGKIELNNLAPGNYELLETEARQEYEYDARAFYFIVGQDGRITDYEVDENGNVSISDHEEVIRIDTETTNKIHVPDPHSINITKKGARGESFAGAEFKLQEWNGTEYVDTTNLFFDNGDGTYSLRDEIERNNKTNKGRFKIVETQAPAGHACDYEQMILVREKDDVLTKKDIAYLNYARENGLNVLDTGVLADDQPIELEAHDTPVTLVVNKEMESEGGVIRTAGGTRFRFWPDESIIETYGTEYYYSSEREYEIEKKYETDGVTERVVVTAEENRFAIEGLYDGTYYLQETQARDGYVLDDAVKTIHVENGKVYVDNNASEKAVVYTYTHENVKNHLVIEKTDKKDGSLITGSSATFEMEYPDGTTKSYSTNAATGKIEIGELTQSGWYTITETRAPDGYWVDDEPRIFRVDGLTHKIAVGGSEEFEQTVTITVQNTEIIPGGNIYIDKVNENGDYLAGAKFGVFEWNKNTQSYEGVLEIVGYSDPADGVSNSYIDADGTEVGAATPTEPIPIYRENPKQYLTEYAVGKYRILNLEANETNLGRFLVKEVEAPNMDRAGKTYAADFSETVDFGERTTWRFDSTGSTDPDTMQKAPVVNEETEIIFEKINTEGEPLEGGVFKVWNSVDGEAAAETFTTGTDGRFTVKKVHKNSTLYVQETKAPIKYTKIKEILEYPIDERGTFYGNNHLVVPLTNEKGARKLKINCFINQKFESYEDVSFVYNVHGIKEDDGSEVDFTMILTPNSVITDEESRKYVTELTVEKARTESGVFLTLPVGRYTITQEKPQRYELVEVVGETEDNTTVTNKVVNCNLVDFDYGEATFINVIDKWNGDSSAASAVNHIGGNYTDPTNGEEVSSAIVPRMSITAKEGTPVTVKDKDGTAVKTVPAMPASNSVVYTDLPYGQYTIEYTDNGAAKSEAFNFAPNNKVFKVQSVTTSSKQPLVIKYNTAAPYISFGTDSVNIWKSTESSANKKEYIIPESGIVIIDDLDYGNYTFDFEPASEGNAIEFNYTASQNVIEFSENFSESRYYEKIYDITGEDLHKYSNLTLDLRAGARVTIRKDNTDVPDTVIDDFIMPGSVDTANWERTSRYELNGIEYGDYKITFTTCDSGTKITRTFPLKIKNPETAVSYRYSKTDNTAHSYNVTPAN